jgi:hypothetical protein
LWLNNGDGTFQVIVDNANNAGFSPLVADFTGDGKSDILWDQESSKTRTMVYSPASPVDNTDAIQSIISGLGSVTTITYGRMTDPTVYTKGTSAAYPSMDVQSSMAVVSSIAADTGLGDGSTYTTTYTYAGAQTDLAGRGSLGFTTRTVADPQNKTNVTTYDLAWPLTGLVASSKTNHAGTANPLANLTNTYSTTSLSGKLASGTSAPGYALVEVSTTSETDYDLSNAPKGTTTTSTQYDSYGNPTQTVVTVTDPTISGTPLAGGGYITATSSVYTNDATNWYIGRLICSQTASVASGSGAGYSTTRNDRSDLRLAGPGDDDDRRADLGAGHVAGSSGQYRQCERRQFVHWRWRIAQPDDGRDAEQLWTGHQVGRDTR